MLGRGTTWGRGTATARGCSPTMTVAADVSLTGPSAAPDAIIPTVKRANTTVLTCIWTSRRTVDHRRAYRTPIASGQRVEANTTLAAAGRVLPPCFWHMTGAQG